jgi:hypothetical protein
LVFPIESRAFPIGLAADPPCLTAKSGRLLKP